MSKHLVILTSLLCLSFFLQGQQPCVIQLVSLKKYDSRIGKIIDCNAELHEKHIIRLTPTDEQFNLSFTTAPGCNPTHAYAFMIEGASTTWTTCADSLQIGRLPGYGTFNLLLKGKINAEEWTETLSVPIVMVRPFAVWWYYVGGGLFLIVIVLVYLRYRNLVLKRRNRHLESVVETRTQELRVALGDKEMLLKEIHHRVKNNLSVISALLDLQQRGLEDESFRKVFDIAKLRVRSVGLIHQLLYQNGNFGHVDVEDFSRKLFAQVKNVFGGSTEVRFETDTSSISLDINNIIPLGLILNELMTNSFKYAFDGVGDPPVIRFTLSCHPEEEMPYVFHYSDNGTGMPHGIDMKKSKTLGLRLLKDLSRQIKGTFEYLPDEKPGAHFRILFKSYT